MLDAFMTWLKTAKHRDRYIYHTGFLMRDRLQLSPYGYVPTPIHHVANTVWFAYEKGLVFLFQRRRGPMDYEYIASRR